MEEKTCNTSKRRWEEAPLEKSETVFTWKVKIKPGESWKYKSKIHEPQDNGERRMAGKTLKLQKTDSNFGDEKWKNCSSSRRRLAVFSFIFLISFPLSASWSNAQKLVFNSGVCPFPLLQNNFSFPNARILGEFQNFYFVYFCQILTKRMQTMNR